MTGKIHQSYVCNKTLQKQMTGKIHQSYVCNKILLEVGGVWRAAARRGEKEERGRTAPGADFLQS
jgi:hypothetical protein